MERFEFPGRFSIRGLDATFERRTDWIGPSYDRGGKLVTEVTVKLSGRGPGAFRIFQKSMATGLPRLFGDPLRESGDRLFDSLYAISARPAALADRLFAPERRASVIAAVRRIGAYVDPLIDLSANRLLVRVLKQLDHERGVRNLVATATDFTGYVLDLDVPEEIRWGDAGAGEGARCPVCIAPLTSDLVHCSRCRTPHHGECWNYLGKCSIFACGATIAGPTREG